MRYSLPGTLPPELVHLPYISEITFEGDAGVGGGAATYHLFDCTNWGFSSTGDFADDDDEQNTHYIATSNSSNIPELYTNARIVPTSLTYVGYCLENGNYTVNLHFAEIQFTNDKTYRSIGRRIFDIYVQDKLVEKDFDIEAKAPGVLNPLIVPYNANVTNNILEIRLYWAGQGTTAIPVGGVYGPLISAISVEPNFKPLYREGKKKTMSIGVAVAVAVVGLCLIILMLGILYRRRYLRTKRWREKEKDQLLLIYEYMENNSLARALFGHEQSQLKLDWPTRHRICLGVAKGLAFLHEESRFKIVHRDIKPTNVLLDRDLSPKISDFGLAKLDEEEKTHISTRIAGTIGYMAPEYAMWGYLTYKADVYSFGIVSLEIVSGKNNMSYVPAENCYYVLDWAFHLYQNGKLMDLVDQNLGFEFDKVEAERMMKVALLCANASPSLRPTMSEVVNMLEGTTPLPDVIPEAGSYTEDMKFKALRDKRLMMRNHIYHSASTSSSSGPSSTHDDVCEVNAEKYMKFKAMRDSRLQLERQNSLAQISTSDSPPLTGSSSEPAQDVHYTI
ncbi:hypothetical protein LWI29_024431 [Acer saccharum]|uniref:non-specific serine/threonine protein kinase n=1 Tax=Acer saccharum TaxID=4024 RepID=A0AA39VGI5_ACESA|nr:hypothetical protein LWI29_024431 [Acer saccharum]